MLRMKIIITIVAFFVLSVNKLYATGPFGLYYENIIHSRYTVLYVLASGVIVWIITKRFWKYSSIYIFLCCIHPAWYWGTRECGYQRLGASKTFSFYVILFAVMQIIYFIIKTNLNKLASPNGEPAEADSP
jgi:hypothetical protein